MGRPLNKKYFGNRNTGSASVTTDDGIGGQGIASITWSNRGAWLSNAGGTDAPLAGLALPAPTLPGGVQATWTNYFGAATVSTGAGSVGLVVGETYEYAAIPGLLVTVATSTNNGTNATFTVTAAGSTTTLLTDLTGVNLTKTTGMTGAATFLVDISLKIVNTVINEPGSGYTGEETFTVTLANSALGTVPVGAIVLTTDSGAVGSSTNQENAIVAYAYVTGNNLVADIQKQVSGRRYKVKTSEGTLVCALVTDGTANAVGEMTITATDANSNTYYVSKLTAHRATLVQIAGGSDYLYNDNQSAPWSFAAAAGTVVQIANK